MANDAGNDLLRAATACAADAQLLCEDLSYLLFPRVLETPSEELQASLLFTLRQIVSGVEQLLGLTTDSDADPQSWKILSKAGLLREPRLIEYCLARIAEENLQERMDAARFEPLEQLPAKLALSGDANPQDLAVTFLAAEGASRGNRPIGIARQLPADLLHLLVWRVIAVFRTDAECNEDDAAALIGAGHRILAGHDEAQTLLAAAAKLAFSLSDAARAELLDPAAAGIPLFVAAIVQEFDLHFDRVMRLIDENSAAPFLTILRARDLDIDAASQQLTLLRGQRKDDFQLPAYVRSFTQLSPQDARRQISFWRYGGFEI